MLGQCSIIFCIWVIIVSERITSEKKKNKNKRGGLVITYITERSEAIGVQVGTLGGIQAHEAVRVTTFYHKKSCLPGLQVSGRIFLS